MISDLRPEPIIAVVEVDDGSLERICSLLLVLITPGVCFSLETTTISSSLLLVSFSSSTEGDDEVAMAAMVVMPYS